MVMILRTPLGNDTEKGATDGDGNEWKKTSLVIKYDMCENQALAEKV